jgi:outer membrane lipoprotein-sorting protein
MIRLQVDRSSKRKMLLLVGVLLAIGMVGCTVKRTPALDVRDGPLKEATLEQLIDLLDLRYRDIRTLRALVEVEAESPKGKSSFYGILLFQRPDQLRLQGSDPFGRTVFDLIAEGEESRIYLPREDRFLSEESDSLPFLSKGGESILGVHDLLEVLGASGGAYLDPALIPALEKKDDFYILYLFFLGDSRAVLFKKLWLERKYFRLTKEEIFDSAGERRLIISFDDYQKVEDRWRPLKVKAEAAKDYHLVLNYSEIQVNPLLKAEDFSLAKEDL